MMKTIRFVLKTVLFIAIAYPLLALTYCLGTFLIEGDKIELFRIPIPAYDAEIAILTELVQESPSPSYYYKVYVGNQVMVPRISVWAMPNLRGKNRDSFTVIGGEDSSLVGVVLDSDPDGVLILHDFATNDSWPWSGMDEHYLATSERGENLLNRLKNETGIADLKSAEESQMMDRYNPTK